MNRNFIGTSGRRGIAEPALPGSSEPGLVNSHELPKTSPAFDAWLQAYRKRLAEACERANARPASPANANG